MLVSVLASGSKGNSCFVKTNDYNILIDVGMSLRYIKEKLSELNTSPSDIDYILITHTHSDHVKGIKSFIKKNNPKIVLSDKMLDDLDYLNDYDNLIINKKGLDLDSVKIDYIKTSHDTSDSRAYIIEEDNSSMVYITDTGYINQKHFDKLINKNLYVFESNHDIEMLMDGPYPSWLKTRILSDVGHLSNESSAYYLSKLIGDNTKKVILAHLSEENNDEALVLTTMKEKFLEYELDFDEFLIAKQKSKTEGITI